MKRDLILLPGLDGTGVLFDDMVKYLEETFQVIRVFYPPAQRCSLEDLSQVVKEKILHPQNSIILAESFSGLVALTLLQKQEIHPKGIIFGMCFVEPPLKTILRVVTKLPINNVSWESIPDLIYRSLCLGHLAKREQIEKLRAVLEKVSSDVFFQRLKLIKAFIAPEKPKKWDIPCVYIQGTKDRLITHKSANWFSKNFEPFSLKKVVGPHFLMQSHAEECAKLIFCFDLFLETGREIQ